ncbi:MAG: Asp23/Gls24 family envelope stress response protein, partial [Micrococcaceae bacterium]|nr:Asp23/Gls24 family envelope stress response protein [Micrococcaceae bacterium]
QRIAEDVRAAVYAAVDELTGLHVIEVNIEIADVCAPEVPEQAVPGPVVPEMPSRAPTTGSASIVDPDTPGRMEQP